MIQMNLLTKQKETHRKLTHGCQGEGTVRVVWEDYVHIVIFKMDNLQGPTIQHMELYSMLCASLDGRGFEEE